VTYTADGVGADWPLDYAELRPSYTAIEQELPVAGEHWPWGDPHGYPYRPHPVGGNGEVFLRGARQLGITAKVGPVAIVNGRFGNRPHCIYRGFCLQGCKVNAKASPLVTHIPDAMARGAEIRANAMVTQVVTDERTGWQPACAICATGASGSSGHGWWRWPGIRSRRRGCC
jgi:choline dehydrogenase-like flavoprotein